MWKPIDSAPKDGRAVWVEGRDWGESEGQIHRTWAYWFDGSWKEAGTNHNKLAFLVYWFDPKESDRG